MSLASTTTSAKAITIRPSHGLRSLGLGELWRYRELLYFLTWRDIKVRYKQTAMGASWAIIQPVLTMVVFSLFFGRLAGIPSDGTPYPLFSFTALVPWAFFASAVTQSSASLVASANLLKKVYFPRLTIPVAAIGATLADLVISFIVLMAMLAYYKMSMSVRVLTLPLFVLLALSAALGVGLWLSALSVRFRDVRYVVPFLTQIWMFSTPIAYPASLVPDKWRTLYAFNPMVGVVEGFRWALLGQGALSPSILAASSGTALLLIVTGAYYFRQTEKSFADVI